MPLAMLPTKSLQHCQDQMIRTYVCINTSSSITWRKKYFLCVLSVLCCVVLFFWHMCQVVSYWYDTTHLDSLGITESVKLLLLPLLESILPTVLRSSLPVTKSISNFSFHDLFHVIELEVEQKRETKRKGIGNARDQEVWVSIDFDKAKPFFAPEPTSRCTKKSKKKKRCSIRGLGKADWIGLNRVESTGYEKFENPGFFIRLVLH